MAGPFRAGSWSWRGLKRGMLSAQCPFPSRMGRRCLRAKEITSVQMGGRCPSSTWGFKLMVESSRSSNPRLE